MTSPLRGLDEPSRMSNRSLSVMAAQPPSSTAAQRARSFCHVLGLWRLTNKRG